MRKENKEHRMKIKSHIDLPYDKDVFIGSKQNHQNFCNRYKLRNDGNIEIQHIYRYGKPSDTKIMTPLQFTEFVNQ